MVLGKEGNELRKLQHLRIVLEENVEGPLTTMLEYVFLPHQAYSDLSPEDIALETRFLGREISAPVIISGMTGGAPGTEKVNLALAKIAEKYRLPIGVGSQRSAIENSELAYTYKIVREEAPDVPVLANLGAAEVVKYDIAKILKTVEMIDADALAIHLNLAQEVVQPEGTPSFRGLHKKLEVLIKEFNVPIIIKEVGNGLSKEVVKQFYDIGIKIFDTEGAGGTNWVLVELYRARQAHHKIKELIASNLIEWGIPTAASILEARTAAPDAVIIGSGGIRTSLDAVKALWLGADLIGMARPFLKAYNDGELESFTMGFLQGLKMAFLLAGAKNVDELRKKEGVITSLLEEWIKSRRLRRP